MITPVQVRMARAALQWTVAELARRAGVTARTVLRYEHSENVTVETVMKMKVAFESVGVIWVPENGGEATVRLPRRPVESA